jgi:hemerythrin-like domain-containing protein
MNLHDLPPGFDDPVEALLGFHRRIERQLAAIGLLPTHLEVRGMDAEASAAAATLVAFFSDALEIHHADEDELLPLLEARTAEAAERDGLRELRQRLEAEHREMTRTWKTLRRPLDGIAEGVHRKLPVDLVHYFRVLHATHISIEEAGLHAAAARRLLPSDRAALGRGMVARRTRRHRYR